VFSYKNEITLNNKFNKSTNIILDQEDCEHYILTQSTKNTLSTFFTIDYHNSLALIGPFGSGKSSLILYLNTLLSHNENNKKCIDILKKNDSELYEKYKIFTEGKNFLKIKIVGEHSSFKEKFKEAILKESALKKTIKYLKEDNTFHISKALDLIDTDLEKSTYTDILFSIDEFGKFIEFGLQDTKENDIFDLQTLAEHANKRDNYKLIISLHKAFGEYGNSQITYTDWDKIQGRFENILFKDDYYEMLNIFKETIVHQNTIPIKKSQKTIHHICDNSILNKNSNNLELFLKIAPIHPFAAITISEIFTKHFQNQRSVFSFLFSVEPHAFQDFIGTERKSYTLYSLNNLYKYITYLLKVYTILLPDQEVWYIAEHKLKDPALQDDTKRALIKTITLIHSFKLTSTLKTDRETLILSLIDQYDKAKIEKAIDELFNDNILIFQEQSQAYSLIENSNININKELKDRLEKNINVDIEEKLNLFIQDKYIIARRYFSEYGSKKQFEKIYVAQDKKQFETPYKIFFSSSSESELIKLSQKNKRSLFIQLGNIDRLEYLIKKIEALKDIESEFSVLLSLHTKEILQAMVSDAVISLEKLFSDSYSQSKIYYIGNSYNYSSKIQQELISTIAEDIFPDAPKINNYTLNHTIASKGTNTTTVKKLFEAMLENEEKAYLGIDKFPAQKALYLSVIKPAGIHKLQKNGIWRFSEPDELNFTPIWKTIKKVLNKKIPLSLLVETLQKEPFGLNEVSSMFIISLYILVHREKMHIVSDNTYKYTLTLDLLMHMWKATDKYQLQHITLNKNEEKLFKAYVQITTDLTEYSYTTDKVSSIVKTLYSKFTLLPHYAKNTQKISEEAKALRSALVSMKDPKEAFFKLFPQALGYKNIENISNDEFIQKFKASFNEIALSYKNEIIELEQYFAKLFHFNHTVFPFGDNLINLSDKLSSIDALDTEIKALLRSFNYANNFIALIDNIAIILINKKIEDCYDNDITILKDKLNVVANKILSKLELADIATETKDVRKISLASFDSSLNRVISIDKNKLDTIKTTTTKLKELIPSEYTHEEKLFLISQLLNEELKNE